MLALAGAAGGADDVTGEAAGASDATGSAAACSALSMVSDAVSLKVLFPSYDLADHCVSWSASTAGICSVVMSMSAPS
ncbi:MAG: hypothetical protein ACO3PQ_04090 [Burkholderiaceae bacterium]